VEESAVSVRPAPSKGRRLTFKEQRELEGMEGAILAAEEKVASIETQFADPDFHRKHGARTSELTRELEAARRESARLYARWEELETVTRGPTGDS
jgi:ATP-binding cassette subfamily F protein uup